MTAITFYGGIGGIGGNKILLEDKGTRVWLDFGESFGALDNYFVGFLQPRDSAGARDYFEFGMLPKIQGLYSREALKFTDLKYGEPEFDAVFVSHSHSDHIAHMRFLDESIPVHVSRIGKAIIDCWEKSSTADYGRHDYRTFEPGKRIKVGPLEFRPFEIDHSIPGACGYIIHTSSGTLVYTGDFRKHGPRRASTLKFFEKAAEEKPDVMICEGTRIAPSDETIYVGDEDDVRRVAKNLVSGTRNFVAATFYPRDVDRITTFSRVSSDSGRQLLVPTDTALLLTSLESNGMKVPKLGKDYRVYARRKRKGTFEARDYYTWERRFIRDAVNFEHVRKDQSKYMVYLSFHNFNELVDIKPVAGHFIHSRSEPMSEEEPEAAVMSNWLEHFKLQFHQIHASGHCSGKEIEEILQRVRPAKLFPIHSKHPELFKKFSGLRQVILPEPRRKYEF